MTMNGNGPNHYKLVNGPPVIHSVRNREAKRMKPNASPAAVFRQVAGDPARAAALLKRGVEGAAPAPHAAPHPAAHAAPPAAPHAAAPVAPHAGPHPAKGGRRAALPPMKVAVSNGAILNPGEQWLSDSGNTMLAYQGDGNLVVYVRRDGNGMPTTDPNAGWEARWASDTYGHEAGFCAMQGDGNLVLYAHDQPYWSSNTWGHDGAVLAIQDDENVVIYHGDSAIWSSNTWVGGVAHSGFDVASRGFAFINNFPDGYWQFGVIRIATLGLCGGMTYAALDYYWSGAPTPSTSATPSAVGDPLGAYINARQQQSVEQNLGGWMVQILNPDDHALHYWSTHDEWNKLKGAIDAGSPVPIGLGTYLNGSASHQVVAVGYREGARERWILTYDPNNRRAEGWVHLPPNALHWWTQEGREYRGFFVSGYNPAPPP